MLPQTTQKASAHTGQQLELAGQDQAFSGWYRPCLTNPMIPDNMAVESANAPMDQYQKYFAAMTYSPVCAELNLLSYFLTLLFGRVFGL